MTALIVALDFASCRDALTVVDKIGEAVGVYKVGPELMFGDGVALIKELKRRGKSVFLDAKLHDIPNTVEKAVARAALLGVDFLTVHSAGSEILRAAVRGRGKSRLKLLAVSVLTHVGASELLLEHGMAVSVSKLARLRTTLADTLGFDGAVLSANELPLIKPHVSGDFAMVTPGIRFPGDAPGDQKRIATPASAASAGATYIVVGRPITRAEDPAKSANLFNVAIIGDNQ